MTWPTLHRGINNEHHGIKNLGQDPSTFKGEPIWEEIRRRGGSIGVFGSMQSWPPMDPGPGGFFVPDTFAHDAHCIPESLSPLQAFNLAQVRRNPRVVDRSAPNTAEGLGALRTMRRAGVRWSTLARLAAQVAGERFDPLLAARRPVFQTVLFWDVFRRQFDPANPPALTTFFTNHVAGVMHRYWKDVFPEDFPDALPAPGAHSREPLMQFAIGELDAMLADVLAWSRKNPDLVVVFAASMGQAAVHRDSHEGLELVVEDLAVLLKAAGLGREDYKALLAMVPQVAIEVRDAAKRAWARDTLAGATTAAGLPFIRVQEIGASLSISVHSPPNARIEAGTFTIGGRAIAWAEAGIRMQEIEPGTAYHIPEGSFAVWSPAVRAPASPLRARINADRVKNWLLAVSAEGPSRITSLEPA
ncbi:MAG: hypothetical protein IPP91_05160 [Betaproteobacteria bacterium]|nr:hypothetical protein [Betaproteobacteria bacterium]